MRSFCFLILACLISFLVSIQRTHPTILYDEIATYTNTNDTLMGIYGSTYFFAAAVTFLLTNFLTSQKLTLYFLLICAAIATLGALLMFFFEHFAILCISRAMIGLGYGPINFLLSYICHAQKDSQKVVILQSLIFLFDIFGSMFTVGPFSSIILHIKWNLLLFIFGPLTFALVILLFIFRPECSNQPFHLTSSTPSNILSVNLIDEDESANTAVTLCVRPFWCPTLWFILTVSGTLNISCMWGNPYLINYFAFTHLEAGYIQVSLFLGVIFGAMFFNFLYSFSMKQLLFYISNVGLIIVSLSFMLISNSTHYAVIECLIFLLGFFGIGPSSLSFKVLSQQNASIFHLAIANSLLCLLTGVLQILSSITINYLSHEKIDIEPKALKYNFWIPMIIENVLASICITFYQFNSVVDFNLFSSVN